MIHENDRNREDYSATYCPEDDKLRLYCGRVERATYDHLRANGFQASPKQDCDFVAVWTVRREDIVLEMIHDADDIGDEDYSPQERAADRQERFEGYRDKRASEAGALADRYEGGDDAYGNQNRGRAERMAARRDRVGSKAVTQWGKAEYWQRRAAGVNLHARYKSTASVRRGRVDKLESELRSFEKSHVKAEERRAAWLKVAGSDLADEVLPVDAGGEVTCDALQKANGIQVLAYNLSGGEYGMEFYHPTCKEANERAERIWGHGFSPYGLLTNTSFGECSFDRLTPREVARLVIEAMGWLDDDESWTARQMRHLKLRLDYEREMLKEMGGMIGELDIVPGGWVRVGEKSRFTSVDGWAQVQKVNRSPTSKRVTSVTLYGRGRFGDDQTVTLRKLDVTRAGEGSYRAPTEQELEEFNARQAESKKAAKAKAKANPAPSLINPTREDAERLQGMLNAHAKKASEVWEMTQAEYSQRSKGDYGCCQTRELSELGMFRHRSLYGTQGGRVVICKLRTGFASGSLYGAPRVVVLTDKSQKPIPFDEMERVRATMPQAHQFDNEEAGCRLYRLSHHSGSMSEEDAKFFGDAAYAGLAHSSSSTQRGLTDEGRRIAAKWVERAKQGQRMMQEQMQYIDVEEWSLIVG